MMPSDTAQNFSLSMFITHPLNTLTFALFIISTISLWAFKRMWIWIPLLALTLMVAYYAHIISIGFLIPVTTLCLCHFLISRTFILGFPKLILLFIATVLSFAFCFHLFPDVNNWLLASDVKISPDAATFNYFWNIDKPFIGFFVLAFQLTLLKKGEWKRIANTTFFGTALLIGAFLLLSKYLDIVHFDVKFASIFLPWIIGNLFLTTIPEEAFFRGFLLDQLALLFKIKHSKWLSNLVISFLFVIVHVFFVQSPAFLFLTFIASFVYGALYILTRSIESAIFAHYTLNVVHFIFFTYPVLSTS